MPTELGLLTALSEYAPLADGCSGPRGGATFISRHPSKRSRHMKAPPKHTPTCSGERECTRPLAYGGGASKGCAGYPLLSDVQAERIPPDLPAVPSYARVCAAPVMAISRLRRLRLRPSPSRSPRAASAWADASYSAPSRRSCRERCRHATTRSARNCPNRRYSWLARTQSGWALPKVLGVVCCSARSTVPTPGAAAVRPRQEQRAKGCPRSLLCGSGRPSARAQASAAAERCGGRARAGRPGPCALASGPYSPPTRARGGSPALGGPMCRLRCVRRLTPRGQASQASPRATEAERALLPL
jgi:hypothetical protein